MFYLMTRALSGLPRPSFRMRLLVVCVAIPALALQIAGVATGAPGGTPRVAIPAQYYPVGAHLAYIPHLPNHGVDCSWGFFCEGNVPLYHFHTQDQLHRLSGWAQYAGWRLGHERMTFALFASRYQDGVDANGIPWSRVAMKDLTYLLAAHDFTTVTGSLPFSEVTSLTNSLVAVKDSGPVDIVVTASRVGAIEVEAIVVFSHGSSSLRDTAVRLPMRQTRVAARSST
jgi:hypothetical protein